MELIKLRIDNFIKLIKSYWKGEKPLWKAYWLWGVIGSLVMLSISCIIILVFAGKELANNDIQSVSFFTISIVVIVTIINLSYCLWNAVSVWRCAFNCKSKFWGYIARVIITLSFIHCLTNPPRKILNKHINMQATPTSSKNAQNLVSPSSDEVKSSNIKDATTIEVEPQHKPLSTNSNDNVESPKITDDNNVKTN